MEDSFSELPYNTENELCILHITTEVNLPNIIISVRSQT